MKYGHIKRAKHTYWRNITTSNNNATIPLYNNTPTQMKRGDNKLMEWVMKSGSTKYKSNAENKQ